MPGRLGGFAQPPSPLTSLRSVVIVGDMTDNPERKPLQYVPPPPEPIMETIKAYAWLAGWAILIVAAFLAYTFLTAGSVPWTATN